MLLLTRSAVRDGGNRPYTVGQIRPNAAFQFHATTKEEPRSEYASWRDLLPPELMLGGLDWGRIILASGNLKEADRSVVDQAVKHAPWGPVCGDRRDLFEERSAEVCAFGDQPSRRQAILTWLPS